MDAALRVLKPLLFVLLGMLVLSKDGHTKAAGVVALLAAGAAASLLLLVVFRAYLRRKLQQVAHEEAVRLSGTGSTNDVDGRNSSE